MNQYIKKSLKIGGLLALCGGLFASGLAGGYVLGKTNNKEADKQLKTEQPKKAVNESNISDLTGTSWLMKQSAEIDASIIGQTGYSIYFNYNEVDYYIFGHRLAGGGSDDRIKGPLFAIDGRQALYGIRVENNQDDILCAYDSWYVAGPTYSYDIEQNPIINITGGNDRTNQSLINFFVSNGTLQQEESSESEESTESAEYLYKIDFNDNINKYAPFGVYSDYFIMNNSTGTYILFEGLFEDSFENQYKRITITYAQGSGTAYGENASTTKTMPNGSLIFMYISYIDINDNEVVACYPVYKNREGGTYYTPETTWRSSAFQHLTILEDSTTYDSSVFSSFDNSRTALSSFNSGGTGVSVYTASSGVFSLLGSAFSALASLMAIQVLPNITLGLLFFLPLIAGIIIAIIWIVKR